MDHCQESNVTITLPFCLELNIHYVKEHEIILSNFNVYYFKFSITSYIYKIDMISQLCHSYASNLTVKSRGRFKAEINGLQKILMKTYKITKNSKMSTLNYCY